MLSILKLNKPNITDFAKERNELLKKAKTDWVLFIDNDETISNLQLPISNQFTSYQLSRHNYFLGQYVGKDKIIRLVKRGTGRFVRKVHEVWEPNDWSKVGFIKTPIVHNTADNLTDYIEKMNTYSDLHAASNLSEGKRSSLIKIIIYPIAKFFVTFIKSRNVVFSIMQSLHSHLSWTKLYFLQH